jgi:GNAT superfamily N-acetyltransferase
MPSPFDTRRITAADSRELRRSVLRPALPVGAELPGDDREGVVHLGAFRGDLLVSTCLICPEECPWQPGRTAWRLRGMATAEEHRGTGAGAAVLTEAAAVARAERAELLWCQARTGAVEFYRAHDWRVHGEVFENEVGPHLRMWLPLTG